MKREENLNCLYGGILAFLLSFGAVSCMATGLRLDVPDIGRLGWICGTAAVVSGVCFRFRWGGTALMCLLALGSWYLWRQEQAAQQTLYLLCHIVRLYDSAYGWGVPGFLTAYQNPESMTDPLAFIGVLVAIAVAWTVCRRKRGWLGMLAAGIPFASCFVVTDTAPDSGYLYIWLLGFLILLLTGGTRRRNLSQGNDLTAMAAVPAAIALALLFLAVPRESYDKHPEEMEERFANFVQELPELWEDVSEELLSSVDGAVQPAELNLSRVGPKAELTYPVMDVKAAFSGTLYLREQDYDTYDGTDWISSRHRLEDFPAQSPERAVGEVTIRTRRVRDVLYLPYYPAEPVTLVSGRLDNSGNVKEYSFLTHQLPAQWRETVEIMGGIEMSYVAAEAVRNHYQSTIQNLLLPKDTSEWARELAGKILSDENSATAAADTIARYVRNSAKYDLHTPRMPSGEEDFAKWFLEESETGYCVHFATATVVLLRAAGIEARYVEGYMTTAKPGMFVTVTADEAHAWAEYYEPLLDAWIVVESTPGFGSSGSVIRETEPPEVETIQQTPTQPPRETETQTEPRETGTEGQSGQTEEPKGNSKLWAALNWLLSAAALAAAVSGQRWLRLTLRALWQRRGSSNDRALARWRELVLLHRLLKETPPEQMEELAQKAKYSRHSISEEELEQLEEAMEAARQRLRGRIWYKRLIDRYIFAAF